MTEREWLASNDPQALLDYLLEQPDESERFVGSCRRPSNRKLRLFACACCRAVWHQLSERCRTAVETSERHADKETEPNERAKAFNVADDDPSPTQGLFAMACLRADATEGASEIVPLIEEWLPRTRQAALLRDIIGNPFRLAKIGCSLGPEKCPIHKPDWLTGTVLSLATAAYLERNRVWKGRMHDHDEETGWIEDGTLDPVRLMILADALEEAGCDSQELLRHLRGWEKCSHQQTLAIDPPASMEFFSHDCPLCDGTGWLPLRSPHVRGCWALDLILGKE